MLPRFRRSFTGTMSDTVNRAGLTHRPRRTVRKPERIVPYACGLARDAWLRARTRDHIGYDRPVMRSGTARSPYGAVGTLERRRWEHGNEHRRSKPRIRHGT